MELHERIKWARERLGITQSFVAQQIGVKPQSVQQWEEADPEQRKTPRAKRMPKLAQLLKVNLGWLTSGEGAPEGASQESPIIDVPKLRKCLEIAMDAANLDKTDLSPAQIINLAFSLYEKADLHK